MRQGGILFLIYNVIGLILSLGDEAGGSFFGEIYVRQGGDS